MALARGAIHKILYMGNTYTTEQKLKMLYLRVSSQKLKKISFIFNKFCSKPPIHQIENTGPNVYFLNFVSSLVSI